MSNGTTAAAPPADNLRCQLEQLNERSRWYATQLWQLPLAYLGLAGVGIAGVLEKAQDKLPWLLLVICLTGYAILFHAFGLHGGIRRAVRNIRAVEGQLQLTKTAGYYPLYTFPLQLLVLLVAVVASVPPLRSLPHLLACPTLVLDVAVVVSSLVLFVKAWPTTEDNA